MALQKQSVEVRKSCIQQNGTQQVTCTHAGIRNDCEVCHTSLPASFCGSQSQELLTVAIEY